MINNFSGMFHVDLKDLSHGLMTAIFAGVLFGAGSVIHGVFSTPNVDIFLVDWSAVFHAAVNAAVIGAEGGFSGYIAKKFFSNDENKVLGKI